MREVTADLVIKGHPLAASPAAPLWLVENAAGDRAAHPPSAVVPADPLPNPRQGELKV